MACGRASGVTLLEMLVVLALIGLLAAISFPSVSTGVDRLRLQAAAEGVTGVLSAAVNFCERRQQAVEVLIDPEGGLVAARSFGPGLERAFRLPSGVRFAGSEVGGPLDLGTEPRRLLVLPGSPAPAVQLALVNSRGAGQYVRIDPITGVTESGPLR